MSTVLKVNLFFLLTMALPFAAVALTPDDYYHPAAQHYIHGNKSTAKAFVMEGLQKFPKDPTLTALAALFNEPPPEQNQDQKDNNDKDKQDNKQNQDNKKDKDKKNEQDQGRDNDKQQQDQPKPKPDKENMKKKEAEQLIMQYADDADSLNKPPKKKGLGMQRKPEKDW